jgi:hypothetical protein
MHQMVESIHDVIRESVRRHNQAIENHIRQHIRNNRTTRLDIEVVMGEMRYETADGGPFFRRSDSASYEIRMYRDIGIRQKLPIGFRPPLPD